MNLDLGNGVAVECGEPPLDQGVVAEVWRQALEPEDLLESGPRLASGVGPDKENVGLLKG